jgi:hypothetical protein
MVHLPTGLHRFCGSQSICPPALLVHGEHDIMAPVTSTRFLYTRLLTENVPAVMHILPQTDHAFDLILPRISPSPHNEFYDVERFLALHAGLADKPELIEKEKEEFELNYQKIEILWLQQFQFRPGFLKKSC